MIRTWARMAWLTAVLAIATLGCRTPPPNVKPPNSPEVLNPPPPGARYDTSVYPKQAFQEQDPFRKKLLEGDSGAIMPARGGSSIGPGMNNGMR